MTQPRMCVDVRAHKVVGFGWAVFLLLAATVRGAAADQVRLSTGEVLEVSVVRLTDSTIVADHPVLGPLVIPREHAALISPPWSAGLDPTAEPAPTAKTDAEPQPAAEPAVQWKRSVRLGLSGTEGNAESGSGRVGLEARRSSAAMETAFAAGYLYATSEGARTKNRAEAGVRNDWRFGESRWGLFAQGKVEYDEFQDWNLRVSGALGPSYQLIRSEATSLRGRAGLGLSREFGGESNSVTPEAIVGLDFEHKVSERTALTAGVEWLPSLSEVPQFRAGGHVGVTTVLDRAAGMSLHAGIADRYDSGPGAGVGRNDFEYFVTLGWDF
ncbi:MAG: DUF481 domain-containing protein [Phycisphaerales bacterium]|nr:DUF481 domain-containing protein [Phycisphaerales bacterium]